MKVGYNSTDLGVTCVAYTPDRASFVDFTTPLLERVTKWVSKAPGKKSSAMSLTKIFDTTSWLLTFVSMVLVSAILIAANKLENYIGSRKLDFVLLIFTPLAMLNAEAMPTDDVTNKKSRRVYTRNIILLHWSVMGMVLAFCFLCNLRAMILKPSMETPVDTSQELLAKGKTPIVVAGLWQEYLLHSVNEWQRKAETVALILPNPTYIQQNLYSLVQEAETHSVLAMPEEIAHALKNKKNSPETHFSKENLGSYYSSWVTSKLSPWKKLLDSHIGLIQQVSFQLGRIMQYITLLLGWNKPKRFEDSL